MFALSVCGDEEWEGGKVNMGHSSGLRHVLPSGWERKGLGPITAFSPFFPSFSKIDLTPDEMFPFDWLSVRSNASYCDRGLSQEPWLGKRLGVKLC